ncbi:MAG: PAS domain-containing protein [Myxococcales bacterium]|nr:PAS domain-containing protein [Myxococcales bacterium]
MNDPPDRRDLVLDSIRIGIVEVDRSGRVAGQNAEASRLLGVSSDQTAGRSLSEILGAGHPAAALLERVSASGEEVFAHDSRMPAQLAAPARTVDLAAAPIGAVPGEEDAAGAVLTLCDRTIGRELESLVTQRTRSQIFEHLAAGLAHEVRNPLAGIRGAAELLLGKLDDPALMRLPELIRSETDRIRRLLDDLGQITRGAELSLRETNLHRILDDLLELHTGTAGATAIRVVREYDPSIPELSADPDRLTQVFLNLIRNAVQALEDKGSLTIRTRVGSEFHMASREGRPSMSLLVDIEDSGSGIDERDLPHIFTPFFTRRLGGSGLGLAIAQHWTVQHDGRIQVESEPGRGTRMRVHLPLRPWRRDSASQR